MNGAATPLPSGVITHLSPWLLGVLMTKAWDILSPFLRLQIQIHQNSAQIHLLSES